jgi:hypothetical protein
MQGSTHNQASCNVKQQTHAGRPRVRPPPCLRHQLAAQRVEGACCEAARHAPRHARQPLAQLPSSLRCDRHSSTRVGVSGTSVTAHLVAGCWRVCARASPHLARERDDEHLVRLHALLQQPRHARRHGACLAAAGTCVCTHSNSLAVSQACVRQLATDMRVCPPPCHCPTAHVRGGPRTCDHAHVLVRAQHSGVALSLRAPGGGGSSGSLPHACAAATTAVAGVRRACSSQPCCGRLAACVCCSRLHAAHNCCRRCCCMPLPRGAVSPRG